MKVSELIEDLKNRPSGAELIVVVPDSQFHPTLGVESVVPESNEKAVLLMARSEEPTHPEFTPPRNWAHKVEARKSEADGKYELLQDGKILLSGIDTEHDAEMCTHAFLEGMKTFGELFRPDWPDFRRPL
jgi:hypothetical protein